jgi:hypothetical protein
LIGRLRATRAELLCAMPQPTSGAAPAGCRADLKDAAASSQDVRKK